MNNQDTIPVYALCYSMIFVVTWMGSRNKSNRLFHANGEAASSAANLLGLHVAGIFWLGLIPSPLLKQEGVSILSVNEAPGFLWICCFITTLILTVITGMKAGRYIHISSSKPVLSDTWMSIYFPVRILFLAAYELFFRGVVLFGIAAKAGFVAAIFISTTLTVLLHVFTGKKEMLGCVPFGIVLCALCISRHAVWPAILLHIALSLSYEIPPINHFFTRLKPSK